jgi:hypothetical protein
MSTLLHAVVMSQQDTRKSRSFSGWKTANSFAQAHQGLEGRDTIV